MSNTATLTQQETETLHVVIHGVTPLLMCRRLSSEEGMTQEEVAYQKQYLDGDGDPAIPKPNFLRCLVNAGRHVVNQRRKLSTSNGTMVTGFLGIKEPFIKVLDFDGDVAKYEEDVNEYGKCQRTGADKTIIRPRFDRWALDLEILYHPEFVTVSTIRELIAAAGDQEGLGDFRPGKGNGGDNGRFRVVTLKQI